MPVATPPSNTTSAVTAGTDGYAAADRMPAEEALRDRERQLIETQRLAQLGSWRWSIESDEVAWSDEMFRIYGLASDGGKVPFADFAGRIHPDDRSMLLSTIEKARVSGRPFEVVHRIVRPDGTVRVLDCRGEVFFDASGQPSEFFGTGQDITELKDAEEALRASEESYRTIFELASDAIFVHDIDTGEILDANRKACEMHGCTLDELKRLGIGGISDGHPPFDVENAVTCVRRAAAGDPQRFEWYVRRTTGERFWVEVSLHRVRILGDDRILASVRNIDERKKAEAALHQAHNELEQRVTARTAELADRTKELEQAEQRFRAIVEASPMPLLLSRLEDGRILYANDRLEALIDVPPGSLIGQKTPDFYYDPADRPRVIDTVLQQGYVRDLELRVKRTDGSSRWVSLSVQRLTYDGELALATSLIDISERKQSEEALRRSEEQFRRLIENASDLISILDVNGVIRYQSPAVKRMLGYEAEDMVGKNAFDYLMPEDAPETLNRLRLTAENPGTSLAAEFRFRHSDGSWRFVEAVGTTLSPDSAAEGVVVNSRDITERKRAEATLRLQKTLLEAQREASIDGILVVSAQGKILSYNHHFIEMWSIPPDVITSGSDELAVQTVLDQIEDTETFVERVNYLYAHPEATGRDEIVLRDGRVFDRYTAPVISREGDYYGRIWFFRDMTAQKRHAEELEQARHEAEHAREQARHYAESLERELKFGRQIQKGLFPAFLPQPDGWEIAVRFHPAWQVAGDFYDAFELPTGHLGLMIADVSGKGVGAALFMALFQNLLHTSAERASNSVDGSQPSEAVILTEAITSTNSYITRVHKHAHMFASVFFGLLDPRSGTLCYVNAGHEPPVIVRSQVPEIRLRPTGPAVGLTDTASFRVGNIQLAAGDLFLAYTDGVTETRNDKRDFFSEERLLELLAAPVPTAAGMLDRIEQAVNDFAGGAPPSDDVSLLALRRK